MQAYKVRKLYRALTPNCETSSFFFITMNLMLSPEPIASGSSQSWCPWAIVCFRIQWAGNFFRAEQKFVNLTHLSSKNCGIWPAFFGLALADNWASRG